MVILVLGYEIKYKIYIIRLLQPVLGGVELVIVESGCGDPDVGLCPQASWHNL